MKAKSDESEKTAQSTEANTKDNAAGPEGYAMLPPSYGMDAADRGLISEGNQSAATNKSGSISLQRAAVDTTPVATAPLIVYEALNTPSEPLNSSTRSRMESRFQHDFSGVRVHTNERAAESAQAIKARAYTIGQDVVFGSGEYAPQTDDGKRLIAHELTHVVQQRGAAHGPVRINDSPQHESEAVSNSSSVIGGGVANKVSPTSPSLQRDGDSWFSRKLRSVQQTYDATKNELTDAGAALKQKAVELKDDAVGMAKANIAAAQQKIEESKVAVVQTVAAIRNKGTEISANIEQKLKQAKQVAVQAKQAVTQAASKGYATAKKEVKKYAGEKLMKGLGNLKGVVLEGATLIDTVLWLQSMASTYSEKGIILAADKARKEGVNIPFSNAQLIMGYRLVVGYVPEGVSTADMFSGWADKQAQSVQKSLDIQDERGLIFTSYEMGELEGAVGTQIVLAFVGVEEVQLGLKVLGAIGGVKGLVEQIQKNPKWETDPAFYVSIFNVILSVVGLNKAAAGKKIIQIAAHSANVVNLVPPLLKLYHDYNDAELEKDQNAYHKALAQDMGAVIKAGKDIVMAIVNNPKAAQPSEEGGSQSIREAPPSVDTPDQPRTQAPAAQTEPVGSAPPTTTPVEPVPLTVQPGKPTPTPELSSTPPVVTPPAPSAANMPPTNEVATPSQRPMTPHPELPPPAPEKVTPKQMPTVEEIVTGSNKTAKVDSEGLPTPKTAPAAEESAPPAIKDNAEVLPPKAAQDNIDSPSAKRPTVPAEDSVPRSSDENTHADAKPPIEKAKRFPAEIEKAKQFPAERELLKKLMPAKSANDNPEPPLTKSPTTPAEDSVPRSSDENTRADAIPIERAKKLRAEEALRKKLMTAKPANDDTHPPSSEPHQQVIGAEQEMKMASGDRIRGGKPSNPESEPVVAMAGNRRRGGDFDNEGGGQRRRGSFDDDDYGGTEPVHKSKPKKRKSNDPNLKDEADGTPGSNTAQNKEARDAVQEINKNRSKKGFPPLTKDQRQRLHQEITKKNYGYKEMIEEAETLFPTSGEPPAKTGAIDNPEHDQPDLDAPNMPMPIHELRADKVKAEINSRAKFQGYQFDKFTDKVTPATPDRYDHALGPYEHQQRHYAFFVDSKGNKIKYSINYNFLTGEIGDIHESSRQ